MRNLLRYWTKASSLQVTFTRSCPQNLTSINTLKTLYSYEVPGAIAQINIHIKYTRIWSDTHGIFLDFTFFMYFLRGKKIRRLKCVTGTLIQNMNDVYKMFFLLTE